MKTSDLSAKVNASIAGVGISAGLNNLKKQKDLECKLILIGGNSGDDNVVRGEGKDLGIIPNLFETWLNTDTKGHVVGADVDDIERFLHFMSINENLINPVPVSYSLRYLSDGSVIPPRSIETEYVTSQNKLVTLSLKGNIEGAMKLNLNIGDVLLTEDSIYMGEVITFLWDSSSNKPVSVSLSGTDYSVNLSQYMPETLNTLELIKKGFLNNSTASLDIYISEFRKYIP
jgi:hypothetical protein